MRLKNWMIVAGLLGLAGCASTVAPALPDGKNRVVDIVNTGDRALQFYALNAERRRAFAGRLFEREVAANYYLTLDFTDGSGACLYDLFAIFPDGQTAEAPQFNTCAEVSWVVSP